MTVNQGPQGGSPTPGNGGVPPQPGGFPAQPGGVPAYANAFPAQGGGVPPYNGGYPPQQGGFPPQPPQKKPVYKRVWFWIVVAVAFFVLVGALTGGDDSSSGGAASGSPVVVTATATETTNAADESTEAKGTTAPPSVDGNSKYGEHPEAENTFIQTIVTAETDYRNAGTDLQRSNVVRSRNRQLSSDLDGTSFEGWTGIIKDVGANGEGKAYVSIEIADGVVVQTWNNAVSDAFDNTLIPEGSAVYNALLNASPGTKITFGGSFVSDDDTTLEMGNITEIGSGTSPEFIAYITSATVG